MSKQNNNIMKIFSSSGNKGQFGSWQQNNPNLVNDPESIQSLQAWGKGWKDAVIGNGSPPLEENNGILYVLSQGIAYLKQQGGVSVEWDVNTTYYIGSTIGKIASWSGLGSDAFRITLVYRSRKANNKSNHLPADFQSNQYWDFVDAVQPQGLSKLDFSAHVGSIAQTSAEETNIPINWGLCDGRSITMPDGTAQNTPDLRDKFLIASSDDKAKGTTGGSFTTAGHALTIGQMPSHTHRCYQPNNANNNTDGNGGDNPRTGYNTQWWGSDTSNPNMSNSGGNQPHPHDFIPPYYSVYYIRRMF